MALASKDNRRGIDTTEKQISQQGSLILTGGKRGKGYRLGADRDNICRVNTTSELNLMLVLMVELIDLN